jgi:hypothetical protein
MKSLVWHPATRLTLDFSQVDFGGPEQEAVMADWLARCEANLQPLTRKGDFECVQHRDHENPWLELRKLPGQIIAAHWKGSGLLATRLSTASAPSTSGRLSTFGRPARRPASGSRWRGSCPPPR